MDIIKMLIHILLIPDSVVPEPILPHSARSVLRTVFARICDFEPMDDLRNCYLSNVDYRMEVVRQQDPGHKFSILPARPKEVSVIQQYRSSPVCDNRYETR